MYKCHHSGKEYEVVGKFDSKNGKIYYVKRYSIDDHGAHCPKSLISFHGEDYREVLEAMNLSEEYKYHYGLISNRDKPVYSKVKDTRLARKMCKKIYKEEDGWLYVKI